MSGSLGLNATGATPTYAGGMPPWSYTPPAPGVTGPVGAGFDLKSPLAGFALQMAQQQLLGPRQGMVPSPQHFMGLQIPQGQVRNPYGYKLGG